MRSLVSKTAFFSSVITLFLLSGCDNNVKYNEILEVSNEGVSFFCSDKWIAESVDFGDDITYQIYCEKDDPGGVDMMFILYTLKAQDIEGWIDETIKLLRSDQMMMGATFSELYKDQFLDINAVSVDFKGKTEGKRFYGKITSFYAKGKSFIYYRQASGKRALKEEFEMIESTMTIL